MLARTASLLPKYVTATRNLKLFQYSLRFLGCRTFFLVRIEMSELPKWVSCRRLVFRMNRVLFCLYSPFNMLYTVCLRRNFCSDDGFDRCYLSRGDLPVLAFESPNCWFDTGKCAQKMGMQSCWTNLKPGLFLYYRVYTSTCLWSVGTRTLKSKAQSWKKKSVYLYAIWWWWN